MKLNEIYDTTQRSVQTQAKFKNRFIEPEDTLDDNAPVKHGYYSHVTDDTDPHMINKISHRDDPSYIYFVEYLIKNKTAQNNPHFPRIYDVTTYTDGNGKVKYKWKMEKLKITLHNYVNAADKDTAVERMQTLAEVYLNSTGVKHFEEQLGLLKTKEFLVLYFCSYIVNQYLLKPGPYKDAIKIIEDLSQTKGRLDKDLHGNNLMIRFGPYAPQLVIIDPFSS